MKDTSIIVNEIYEIIKDHKNDTVNTGFYKHHVESAIQKLKNNKEDLKDLLDNITPNNKKGPPSDIIIRKITQLLCYGFFDEKILEGRENIKMIISDILLFKYKHNTPDPTLQNAIAVVYMISMIKYNTLRINDESSFTVPFLPGVIFKPKELETNDPFIEILKSAYNLLNAKNEDDVKDIVEQTIYINTEDHQKIIIAKYTDLIYCMDNRGYSAVTHIMNNIKFQIQYHYDSTLLNNNLLHTAINNKWSELALYIINHDEYKEALNQKNILQIDFNKILHDYRHGYLFPKIYVDGKTARFTVDNKILPWWHRWFRENRISISSTVETEYHNSLLSAMELDLLDIVLTLLDKGIKPSYKKLQIKVFYNYEFYTSGDTQITTYNINNNEFLPIKNVLSSNHINKYEVLEKMIQLDKELISVINKHQLLKIAIDKSDIRSVKILIENGADINIKIDDKPTIFYAIEKGNAEIVQYLVEKGAKTNFFFRENALDYARKIKTSQKIINFLQTRNDILKLSKKRMAFSIAITLLSICTTILAYIYGAPIALLPLFATVAFNFATNMYYRYNNPNKSVTFESKALDFIFNDTVITPTRFCYVSRLESEKASNPQRGIEIYTENSI